MDRIANYLTTIRNGVAKGKERVDVPFSKIQVEMAKVMKEEGYLSGYRMMEENKIPFIRLQLKYTDERQPVITGLKRVSRSGLRLYDGYRKIPRVDGGMGIAILSTSKGIMTNRKARKLKVGGEILCHIW